MIRMPVSLDIPIVPAEGKSGVVSVFFPGAMCREEDALKKSWNQSEDHTPGTTPQDSYLPILFKNPEVRVVWSFSLMEPYPGFSGFVSREVLDHGFVESFDEHIALRPESKDQARYPYWNALTNALLDYFPSPAKGDDVLRERGRWMYRSFLELLKFQEGKGLHGREQMELLCIGNALDCIIGDNRDAEIGARVHIVRYDRDDSVDCSLNMLKYFVLHNIQKSDKDCHALPKEVEEKINVLAPHLETRIRMEALYFSPRKENPLAKGSET